MQNTLDRADLLNLFKRVAATDPELHVDDVSEKWRELTERSKRTDPVPIEVTLYVGLWRGKDDDEQEAGASDMFHPGRVWITFPRGQQPERSSKLRATMLSEIFKRWPDAQPIPVLPSGGLPFSNDLQMTDKGYKIVKSAALRYELPASSEIVVSD